MMAVRAWEVHVAACARICQTGPGIQYPVSSMHVISRLSRSCHGGGPVRADMAHHLFKEQGAAGCLRSRRKTWRVWQEAASHVPGYNEICPGSGGWVHSPACRLP